MSDSELRKVLNFTDEDLSANRMGRITPKQSKALDQSDKTDVIIAGIMGAFYIAIAIVFSFVLIRPILAKGIPFTDLFSAEPKTLAIIGGIWLLMGVLAGVSLRKAFIRVKRTVQKMEGKVRFAKVERRIEIQNEFVRNEIQYDLHVTDNHFSNVNERLMNLMKEGDSYTVYYVDGFGILSAERIKIGK